MLDVARLLSRGEVCRLLGVSYPTLWREVQAGKLPAVRIGRRVLFKREDLAAYIEWHRTERDT